MENATKALLIAAAVLIAILLISLGVGVFNTASEQMSGADLSEYEAQKFNEKFTKYNGENKTGAEVNALLQTVFTHNNAQPDTSTCVSVTVGDETRISNTNNITAMPTKVNVGGRYTVTCSFTNGLVSTIAVTTPTE